MSQLASLPVAAVTDFRDDYKLVDVGNVAATLTASQLLRGILYSNPATAVTLTLPTAALLVAMDQKAAVGSGLHVFLRNDNGVGVLTVAAGTGVTLAGKVTVGINSSAHFYVTYTNVTAAAEAVTVARLA